MAGPSSLPTEEMACPEAQLASENSRLFDQMDVSEAHRGGRRVQAPRAVAERLHAALLAGFKAGEAANGSCGGLLLSAAGRYHTFWGFETYDRVQAPLDKAQQRKHTTMLPVHEVEEVSWRPLLSGGLDGLDELIAYAKGMLAPPSPLCAPSICLPVSSARLSLSLPPTALPCVTWLTALVPSSPGRR